MDRIARRTAIVGLFLVSLTAATTAGLANSAAPAHADVPYCFRLVAAFTDCAAYSGETYANGVWDQNAAQYPGAGTVNVCEHTYATGGETISDRCANKSWIRSCISACTSNLASISPPTPATTPPRPTPLKAMRSTAMGIPKSADRQERTW